MTDSHRQRWITAIIVLPFLIAAVAFGGWALLAAMILVSALGQYEFYSMFWPGRSGISYKVLGCLLGTGLLYGAYIESPHTMIACIIAAFWAGSLGFLVDFGSGNQQTARFERAQILTAGLLYLPLLIQSVLRFSIAEIGLILLCSFASDIGGFYAGCNFGKHKIWPSVSPKKTWEGSLGGMLFCTVMSVLIGMVLGSAPWYAWALLGVALNIASQLGDFFESALKRTLGVKDSGTMLPGHGGILDRIDSILLALPTYALARELYAFF